MQLKYSYYHFASALSPELCQKIIDAGLAQLEREKQAGIDTNATTMGGRDKRAVLQENPNAIPMSNSIQELVKNNVVDIKTDEEAEKKIFVRDSEVSWLTDQWIYDLVMPYLNEANRKAGWNFETDYSESLQFTAYHGGGFYGWHADGGSDNDARYKRFVPGITPTDNPDKTIPPTGYTRNKEYINKVRKLSMTVNLNRPEDYDGGELEFDYGSHFVNRFYTCEEIKPQGSIIVFPSFIYHQVKPVTRGTRYSLVMWRLGQPFK